MFLKLVHLNAKLLLRSINQSITLLMCQLDLAYTVHIRKLIGDTYLQVN